MSKTKASAQSWRNARRYLSYSGLGLATILVALAGCSSSSNNSASAGSGANGSTGVGGGASGGGSASGGSGAGIPVTPNECDWERGERPTAALPPPHNNEYVIDLGQWNISNTGQNPVETRTRLNEAIVWAKENGFNKVVIPPGTYLVGEATTNNYAGGINLQGDMTLELSNDTVIAMAPNDRWNYCVINVNGNSNITIRGGEIIGDRDQHDYGTPPTAHDEGHGICIWSGVDRVLVENMELHELTGDGVLIVGVKEADDVAEKPTTNVTIRNNNIHHNRRQGVSVVGGHNVVIEDNHIHHIEGTSPQFGVDIEGAGRSDKDILIFRNNFHNNAGGDFVTSTGRNVWVEENKMAQCQVNSQGQFDASLPCLLDKQVDGPVIVWKETDNVIINNEFWMSKPTVNGYWAILGYVSSQDKTPTRDNEIGNYIGGNTFHDSGIHMAHNMKYVVSNNTLHNGLILAYNLACTRLESNRINREAGENYKLRNVAGVSSGNILNRSPGADPAEDYQIRFPMADDAPYRNSSPVFW